MDAVTVFGIPVFISRLTVMFREHSSGGHGIGILFSEEGHPTALGISIYTDRLRIKAKSFITERKITNQAHCRRVGKIIIVLERVNRIIPRNISRFRISVKIAVMIFSCHRCVCIIKKNACITVK